MKNSKYLILLLMLHTIYAVPMIGITQLRYAKDTTISESSVIKITESTESPSLSTTPPNNHPAAQWMLAQTKIQLAQLRPRLMQKLSESNQFIVFNAESAVPTNNSPKYILQGWIQAIKVHEDRATIMHTQKISVLSSLDIIIEYKITNPNTHAVITDFVAMGHDGIARIVATNDLIVAVDPSTMVNNAITSLLTNIQHSLSVKQNIGIIAK